MTKLFLILAILMSGLLCLTGCGSDSDDSGTTAAADSASAPAAPAADAADTPADEAPAADPSAAANAAFAAITPSGISQTDKFVISGRGSVFTVACNAIADAVSYTFTSSFGSTATSSTPSAGLNGTVADGGSSYTLSVYATNADGINTKTGSATVN